MLESPEVAEIAHGREAARRLSGAPARAPLDINKLEQIYPKRLNRAGSITFDIALG
ncbi:MAG: hypothetical protein IIB66_09730 [Proteobacteria bacterium]|nr:hypothetical protein [Pseudomonadota bacterium]